VALRVTGTVPLPLGDPSTQRSMNRVVAKNSSGKISGFAAAAVMPFFGQQPAGCVPRSP
jgi:hypothetical protein